MENRPSTRPLMQGYSLAVNVSEAGTGLPLTDFKFIVNENNVGDPQVEVPEQQRDPGLFPSLRPGASHSPVVASGPPAAPVILTAAALTATSVKLEWIDNCGEDCGFLIERKRESSGTFSQTADVPPGGTTYTDTGLAGNTNYYYRVRAYNEYGKSGYSNIAHVRTPISPPRAPSILVAGRFAGIYVLLAWKDDPDQDDFIIERRSQHEADFAEIGRAAKDTNWYFDRIDPGTAYYYRVRAQNSGGSSGYSNVAEV